MKQKTIILPYSIRAPCIKAPYGRHSRKCFHTSIYIIGKMSSSLLAHSHHIPSGNRIKLNNCRFIPNYMQTPHFANSP